MLSTKHKSVCAQPRDVDRKVFLGPWKVCRSVFHLNGTFVICCKILLKGKIVRIEATKRQDNMVLFFLQARRPGRMNPMLIVFLSIVHLSGLYL